MRTVAEVEQEARIRELRAYAVCSAFLALISEVYFDFLGARHSEWIVLQVFRLIHIVLIAGIIVWLARAGRFLTARQCTVAGFLVTLPLPVILWLNQEAVLASTGDPDLFLGHHLAVILVAVLFPGSPRTVLGVASVITLVGLVHVALWHARGLPMERVHEPGVLLLHWAAACVIVVLRASLDRARVKYERARAALVALNQLASATRALRDGANTPLQTIETIAFLQRRLSPSLSDSASRLERCSSQLRRVLEAIEYEDLADWKDRDVSFRAEKRLAELRENLIRDAGLSSPEAPQEH